MTAYIQIPNFRNDLGIMPSQVSLRLVGRGLQPGSSRDRLCQGSVAALGSIFPDRVLHSSAFSILELEPLPLLRGWQDLHLCDLINPDLINRSRHRLVGSPLLFTCMFLYELRTYYRIFRRVETVPCIEGVVHIA